MRGTVRPRVEVGLDRKIYIYICIPERYEGMACFPCSTYKRTTKFGRGKFDLKAVFCLVQGG